MLRRRKRKWRVQWRLVFMGNDVNCRDREDLSFLFTVWIPASVVGRGSVVCTRFETLVV
ncbi:hypothetical protein DPMN_152410 [Dreissena polymorpha]|uniref:Uncharacterized protein n=1 Tax=Dreissena polymorpha TaxID=45954 RepID=A0A9D4FI84_DREPO|nr:hypothetical protein DPMN_152410 [Dreissena polymorpha]